MIVFWDIDGTLLNTGRAGIFAWQDALCAYTGVAADLDRFDTAGLPDHGIARRLLSSYAGIAQPNSEQIADLVRGYEDRLPSALHRRAGRVLPNVREILETLATEPGCCSLLLTGNTERGARAKLAHYGLLHFFPSGGYSEGDNDRALIAHSALERAGVAGHIAPGPLFVVGDTPHDVRCGAAIGAKTIAVATGRHSPEELAGAGPWRVLDQFPPPPEFLALLGEVEVPADA